MTGLRAQMSGFTLGKGFNEGTSEPFVARMMASIFEIRDRALTDARERQSFEAAYRPIIEDLIEVRRILRERAGITGSVWLERPAAAAGATPADLIRAVLDAMSGLLRFFNLPQVDLMKADEAFSIDVAALYAHDPQLATYLLGARSDWLGQLSKGYQQGSTNSVPGSDDLRFQLVAALVENVVVHLFRKRLARQVKSLTVVEIPTEKRDLNFRRRFFVVLATEAVKAWAIQYEPTGFGEQ